MDNIKNIVSDVIQKILNDKGYKENKIERIWQNVLSENQLKHTKIAGQKEHDLLIYVDSPAWLYQLNSEKRKILCRIQEECEDIKNISFKIGNV